VPDLVLDYSLLHELAGSMRSLRAEIQTDVEAVSGRSVVGAHGEVGAAAVGNSTLFGALSGFYAVCHQPFKDSMDKLQQLADTLDGVAKAFFDVDADFAGKVNTGRLQAQISQWQAAVAAHDAYERLKDQVVTYQYYDEHGNLQTATIPLWDPNKPPPPDPGPMPTSLDGPGAGGKTSTSAQVDGNGRITSETSTVTTDNGLTYTETTTYSYIDRDGDGKPDVVDYTTSITHSDGTTETIVKSTNSDDSYVMKSTTDKGVTTTTVTPKPGTDGFTSVTTNTDGDTTTTDVTVTGNGTGTKTVTGPDGTDVYTGNPTTNQWTLSSHTDPEPDYSVPVLV
jgi:hypothetical protein